MPDLYGKFIASLKSAGVGPTLVKAIKYPFKSKIAEIKLSRILVHEDPEAKFTHIYQSNYWSSKESASGEGSTLAYTANLRARLPDLFEQYSVRSVFDAPCGDFNWMRHVVGETGVEYIGGDIVLPLINSLNEKYRIPNVRFIHIDLTRPAAFPTADLMICRDCLFHLSNDDIRRVLENFVSSQISYLLTTTHKNSGHFANRDIPTGDFRFIDLFSAPYCFPGDALARIDDWHPPHPEREMCLWSRDQVISVLTRFAGSQPSVLV